MPDLHTPCPDWFDTPWPADLDQVPYVHDGDFIVDRSPVSIEELDEMILDCVGYWAKAWHGHDHCLSLYMDQIGSRFDQLHDEAPVTTTNYYIMWQNWERPTFRCSNLYTREMQLGDNMSRCASRSDSYRFIL
jgi:hypothetical protein